MGFLSSFFGHAAANAINEANKETKKHNELCYQLSDYNKYLDDYLKKVGCDAVYIADWGCIDSGSIDIEKRKMDTIRKKVEQYIQLGGNPHFIHNLDELDDYIEKVKFLKSKECLERQQEFEYQELSLIELKIEREEKERLIVSEEKSVQQEIEDFELMDSDINTLSGVEFEKICQKLVEKMGFATETTKASGDGGIDLIAYNNQPLLAGKYIIQCKRYSGSVGEPIIRDLYGVVMSERANKGILMTTGYFTKSAITFANGKPIELIDGKEMQGLLSNNGISAGKSNTFYSKLLSTIGINDFENICMQFICNQNYHIKNIMERSDKYILIEADDNDNCKKFLFVCCQELECINEQVLNGILQNVRIAEFDKLIVIGTSEFDKACMPNVDENKIEIIGVEKFLNMLRKQGIVDDEGINLKLGIVSPDKEAILNDVYGFMKSNYISNVNDIETQLSFMEVLNETIFGTWHENKSDEVLDKLIREYFMVEEKLEGLNENIQYMLLYVRTNILWCEGKIDEIVEAYKKLLEWDILVNSLEYENGLEDIYLGVVYNLYQLLLIKNCVQEGKEIYQKHNSIIQYGLAYYKGEIEYGEATGDIEYAQQWQNVYDIISNGKIGEIFVLCNLDNYVISEIHRTIGYKSMILGCFGSVEDTKSTEWIGLDVSVDLIDFEQREDGFYVRKKEGMERMQLV